MGKEGLPHIESPIHIKGEEGRKPTTGKTAGMASLAACSTGSGVSRWSAQSCGPRRQSWRRMALASPGQVGSVLLCRRDRRHGKPGGLLHWGRTRRSAPTDGTIGLRKEQRVKGAKADRNVGRRPGGLPHKKSLPHENRPQTRVSAPQRRPARHHSVCPQGCGGGFR